MSNNIYASGIEEKYPATLLEGAGGVEGNLVSCLLIDLSLYEDVKGQVQPDDFITKDGRFLFGIAQYLHDKGYKHADEVTVYAACDEKILEKLAEMGDWVAVERAISLVNIANWDAYLDEFHKRTILLSLYDRGFDIFKEVKLNNGKTRKPIDMFRGAKWDSAAILSWYEEFISQLTVDNTSGSTKVLDDDYIDFDDAFFKSVEDGEAVGVSIATAGTDVNGNEIEMFPDLSKHLLGLERATTTALAAHSGCGKTNFMLNMVYALLSQGMSGVYISNEMSRKALMTLIILMILSRQFNYKKLTKAKFKTGQFTDEDKIMLKKASQFWKDNYQSKLKLVTMADADSPLTSQIIKKECLRNGIDFFVVDTFKLDMSNADGETFWMPLIEDSRALDCLAKRYNVIGLYTIQLAIGSLGNLFLDATALSMCKAVKEVVSNLLMMRKVYLEEFDAGGAYDFHPFTYSDDPVEPGQARARIDYNITEDDLRGVYRCLFVDKSRSSADALDTETAYLYRFYGDYCQFQETCMVSPKHKRYGAGS